MKLHTNTILLGCFIGVGALWPFFAVGGADIRKVAPEGIPVVLDEPVASDPCWFNTKAGMESADKGIQGRDPQTLRAIYDRRLYGFAEDTPLREALRLFNLEEIQCVSYFKDYPPLTEDELIAAILVGVNQNERGTTFPKEREALWQIASRRMLPKGSRLGAWNAGNIQGSPLSPYKTINAKGIEIYLLLGADKDGRTGVAPPTKPEEYLIVRKTFSGIEIK